MNRFVAALFILLAGCQRLKQPGVPAPLAPTRSPGAGVAPSAPVAAPGGGTAPSQAKSLAEPAGNEGKGESPAPTDRTPKNGEARCVRVVNANVLHLEPAGEVTLLGLRAPDSRSPGADEVVRQLKRAVEGNAVLVEFCSEQPKDADGRWRVIVAYRDVSKRLRNLNQLMLLEGLARYSVPEKCHKLKEIEGYQQFEEAAWQQRKGLWSGAWANDSPSTGQPSSPTGKEAAPAPSAGAEGGASSPGSASLPAPPRR